MRTPDYSLEISDFSFWFSEDSKWTVMYARADEEGYYKRVEVGKTSANIALAYLQSYGEMEEGETLEFENEEGLITFEKVKGGLQVHMHDYNVNDGVTYQIYVYDYQIPELIAYFNLFNMITRIKEIEKVDWVLWEWCYASHEYKGIVFETKYEVMFYSIEHDQLFHVKCKKK